MCSLQEGFIPALVNLDGTKYDSVEPQCSVEASSSSKKKYTEADDQHVAKI